MIPRDFGQVIALAILTAIAACCLALLLIGWTAVVGLSAIIQSHT